jgi:hypothetical protein
VNLVIWKITIFNGKIHYKWPFSIAMLNYQRVFQIRHDVTAYINYIPEEPHSFFGSLFCGKMGETDE